MNISIGSMSSNVLGVATSNSASVAKLVNIINFDADSNNRWSYGGWNFGSTNGSKS